MTRSAGFLVSALALALTLVAVPRAGAESQPTVRFEPAATVSGPITGGLHGKPWFAAPFKPADYGYAEQEYFIAGTARAFGAGKPPARYVTRMLVYRPTDPARFSGKAVVEWNNVTGQMDIPVDFIWNYPQAFADGDAYVQVTAQQAGVCAIGPIGVPLVPGAPLAAAVCTPFSLKGYDPLRYGSLVHPGDAYAFDIFSQAGAAVRDAHGVSPLGDLRPRRVIAVGESQSAVELDNYLTNGADATARVFDGFVIDADAQHSTPTTYRVPTLHLWSEESAQPVTRTTGPNHVIWSVAGSAHFDSWAIQHLLAVLPRNALNAPGLGLRPPRHSSDQQADFQHRLGNYGQEGPGPSTTCAGGSQFPRRYAVDAAITAVDHWIRTGEPAPAAPPLKFTAAGRAASKLPAVPFDVGVPTMDQNLGALGATPLVPARDRYGNAIGGLRLPPMTVPVASYNGTLCVLLGTTTPLPPATLHSLYPSHRDYVAAMLDATTDAVRTRYLTRRDGIDLMRRACDSAIPAWGTTPPDRQPGTCHDLNEALAVDGR